MTAVSNQTPRFQAYRVFFHLVGDIHYQHQSPCLIFAIRLQLFLMLYRILEAMKLKYIKSMNPNLSGLYGVDNVTFFNLETSVVDSSLTLLQF